MPDPDRYSSRMDAVEIIPPDGPINATVRPPGSKSITNRALPIAAVAKGTSTLTGVLKSDDTIYMIQALKQLGVKIDDSRLSDIPEESVVIVHGCNGRFPAKEADLFLGNSGTSIRFLTAIVAACGRGTFRLDGIERMRQRPIGDLVNALAELGAEINYELTQGFPPLSIATQGLGASDRRTELLGTTSSQFTSGLLMALRACSSSSVATADSDSFQVTISKPIVSESYVQMTHAVMRLFGGEMRFIQLRVTRRTDDSIRLGGNPDPCWQINPAGYVGAAVDVEPDASAASYWFAANSLGSPVTVSGLDDSSIQGDFEFSKTVTNARHGGTFDFSDISDTAQTMAAVAVFADSPTTITGVEHMRHKECDRVSAVVTELRKLGIECDEHQDGYTIYPGTPVCKEPIETYDDHRMAMSFALLGLKVPGIIIKDPDCVNKTYPRFWDDWAKVTGKPVRRFSL